ncbi:Calmodulin-like protein 3 [Phytophthora citrophthora]|uniref:Calmodulin-like protein 3 n=1 Tax=Phytophthora citrophthora TaxID=4793 RepID=A0AAD9LMS7_9STRA|nr:Calmodulin-like protein 3 [Phytophthora citrophthora]
MQTGSPSPTSARKISVSTASRRGSQIDAEVPQNVRLHLLRKRLDTYPDDIHGYLVQEFGGVLVTPEQIRLAFQFLDVEKKGRVTLDNLRSRLGIFYDNMSLKDVRLLVSEEGELTEEYLHALLLSNEVKNFDPVAEAFKAYDPEETGFISREMLRYVFERLGYGALTEEDLDVLISCADADRDGRINLADFRSMLE